MKKALILILALAAPVQARTLAQVRANVDARALAAWTGTILPAARAHYAEFGYGPQCLWTTNVIPNTTTADVVDTELVGTHITDMPSNGMTQNCDDFLGGLLQGARPAALQMYPRDGGTPGLGHSFITFLAVAHNGTVYIKAQQYIFNSCLEGEGPGTSPVVLCTGPKTGTGHGGAFSWRQATQDEIDDILNR